MARKEKFDLGGLADNVLAHVASGQLVKTASLAYTSVQTDLGRDMVKLAAVLKSTAGDVSITNEDLSKFRAAYGV